MSRATERDAIRLKIVSVLGSVPISWDAFNGAPYQPVDGTAYYRPRIEDGEAGYSSLGGANRQKRTVATLIIEVYKPAGDGDEAGNASCDSIVAGFKDYQTAGISFMWAGAIRDAGTDAGWHKWMVFLTYYNTETV